MSYIVKSTERTKKSGSEGETKALLHLMSFREDSEEIHFFVIDFFNDVTGMDKYSRKMWDVQSKADKNSSPRSIGQDLVTLFKNYISEFDFSYYILFLGGVSNTFRKNNEENIFGINNVKDSAKKTMIEGLKNEALKKTYIDSTKVTDTNIEKFVNQVIFVVDDKKSSEYVKEIVKNHIAIIPNEETLIAIFNEIRNKQSEKKNINVENLIVEAPGDSLEYCKYITSSEIKMVILQRILNRNPLEKGVPISFTSIFNKWPEEIRREKLEECQQSLCRALFNKNVSENFWELFEEVYSVIKQNPNKNIQDLYKKMDLDKCEKVPDFDILSLKYFISVMKDGIENENN